MAYKKETGECKLEISMTFADDAGEYSIFIKNPHGEVSASASLLEEGTQHPLLSSSSPSDSLTTIKKQPPELTTSFLAFLRLCLQSNMKPI